MLRLLLFRVLVTKNHLHFRDVVAEMLSAVDPIGVRLRSRRRMIRRSYRLKVRGSGGLHEHL